MTDLDDLAREVAEHLWNKGYGTRVQFDAYLDSIFQPLKAERDKLREENAILRGGQKACEICDGPTVAEVQALRAKLQAAEEALLEERRSRGATMANFWLRVKNVAEDLESAIPAPLTPASPPAPVAPAEPPKPCAIFSGTDRYRYCTRCGFHAIAHDHGPRSPERRKA